MRQGLGERRMDLERSDLSPAITAGRKATVLLSAPSRGSDSRLSAVLQIWNAIIVVRLVISQVRAQSHESRDR